MTADSGAPRTSARLPAFPVVIRLPRTSYLVVLFLFFGALPLAFSNGASLSAREAANADAQSEFGWRLVLLLIPVIAAIFIARTATIVTPEGLRVRAAFGSRMLTWDSLHGLEVRGRSVYAVSRDGITRLPCVRLAHLGPLSRLSGGRLPELADSTPKPAPQRKRRR